MNSFQTKCLLAVIISLACSGSAWGASSPGTAFTYQGRLLENGARMTGTCDLKFTLHDAQTSGSQVGNTLTQTGVAVADGLFTVTLDFGDVFNGQARWLELGVKTNGASSYVTLSPRQALLPSPQAQYAAAAGTANSASIATNAPWSGISGMPAGFADGVDNDTLYTAGGGLSLSGTQFSVSFGGGGTADTSARSDHNHSGIYAATSHGHAGADISSGTLADARLSANVALRDADQSFSGTNLFTKAVGIGTNNPQSALHVAGTVMANGFSGDGAGLVNLDATRLAGTIAPANIAPGSLTGAMLAAGAVGTNQLAVGAVTTGALADGAVTAAKVATVSNWVALTLANPTPAYEDDFGSSVAAVGTDRVLIGADRDDTGAFDAGAAYLFSANGTLLTTFTNPTPAGGDDFGCSVAAVGTDRVLIGADRDDTGAFDAGAAYLFSTSGALLTVFTNPTPATFDDFGCSVAAVGTDRVLIGALAEDTGALNAGAAYLFSTNGVLLTTFTNPTGC